MIRPHWERRRERVWDWPPRWWAAFPSIHYKTVCKNILLSLTQCQRHLTTPENQVQRKKCIWDTKGRKSRQIPIYHAIVEVAQTYPSGKRIRTSTFFSGLSLFDTNLRPYRKPESYFVSHQISERFSATREPCVVGYKTLKPPYDVLLLFDHPCKSAKAFC